MTSLNAKKTSSYVKETYFYAVMTSFQVLSSVTEASFIGSRALFNPQEKDFSLGGRRLSPLPPRSFSIGLQPLKVRVLRVSFEVKVKGEHRNFALGKIFPKGKFRSSPSPKIFTLTKNRKPKPLTDGGTKVRGRRSCGTLQSCGDNSPCKKYALTLDVMGGGGGAPRCFFVGTVPSAGGVGAKKGLFLRW